MFKASIYLGALIILNGFGESSGRQYLIPISILSVLFGVILPNVSLNSIILVTNLNYVKFLNS